MRVAILSFFVFIIPVFPAIDATRRNLDTNPQATPAGIILPRPKIAETFLKKPKPITIRIVNQGNKAVYLQGVREIDDDGNVQIFFYHREGGRGWKPYFDSLPCNLPTCRNLHSINSGGCGQSVPFVIRLGSAGSLDSVKEFHWGGLLYQRIEATREARANRYCYKGWIPHRGRVRVEVEYSETINNDAREKGMIGGRDHTAIEFNLPPSKEVYEMVVKR